MRTWMVSAVIVAVALSGCTRAAGDSETLGGSRAKGRYVGVGLYPAGRMWEQLVVAEPVRDAAAAKPSDDDQIVVVLDSTTGELRQCGNLSGVCIGMNPWSKPPAATAPAAVSKHLRELDEGAEAAVISVTPTAPRP